MTTTPVAIMRFCLVGVCGFVADAGVTLLLTQSLQWHPLTARIAAFVVAATLTWSLNRSFTFRSQPSWNTWLPYLIATAVGASINVGVYSIWVSVMGAAAMSLLVGVALGSIVALGFNFGISREIFLRGRRGRSGGAS